VRDANPLGSDATPTLERSPALPVLEDVSVNPPKQKAKPAPAPPKPDGTPTPHANPK
jgi:hypothetical protein